MKKILLGLCSILMINLAVAASECPQYYHNGNEPQTEKNVKELCLDGFVVKFSLTDRSPLWSAENLTGKNVLFNRSKKRINNFHEERKLNENIRASNKDYINSKYDKGHLTPYKDQAQSVDINSLSNIVPQSPKLNRIKWEQLEEKIRNAAIKYKNLYVITGVIFGDEKTIGNGIPVPTKMYKIIYYPNMVKAYIADNKDDADINETTLETIESLTNITFH